MEGGAITLLLILIFLYWLTPLVLIIVGLVKWRSKPRTAKICLIVAGIMLLVGLGFCGILIN